MRVTDVGVVRGPLVTHGVRQRFQACLGRIFVGCFGHGYIKLGTKGLNSRHSYSDM